MMVTLGTLQGSRAGVEYSGNILFCLKKVGIVCPKLRRRPTTLKKLPGVVFSISIVVVIATIQACDTKLSYGVAYVKQKTNAMNKDDLKSEPRHISHYMERYLQMARTYVDSKPSIKGEPTNPFVCLLRPAPDREPMNRLRS